MQDGQGLSALVSHRFWDDGYAAKLGTQACSLYICLCRFTQSSAIPSDKELQKLTGLSGKAVRQAWSKLLEYGVVAESKNEDGDREVRILV